MHEHVVAKEGETFDEASARCPPRDSKSHYWKRFSQRWLVRGAWQSDSDWYDSSLGWGQRWVARAVKLALILAPSSTAGQIMGRANILAENKKTKTTGLHGQLRDSFLH